MATGRSSVEAPLREGFQLFLTSIDIDRFDFLTKSFRVCTELRLRCGTKESNFVCLKIGKGIQLPSANSNESFIRVDNNDAEYYRLPNGIIDPSNAKLNSVKDALPKPHTNDQSYDRLVIFIPKGVSVSPGNRFSIKFCLNVVNPRNVVFNSENPEQCYTYKGSDGVGTYEWVPSFEDITQISTVVICITTNILYQICAAGVCALTLTNDNNRTCMFHVDVPTFIDNIGFAFGQHLYIKFAGTENCDLYTPDNFIFKRELNKEIVMAFNFFPKVLKHAPPLKNFSFVIVDNIPGDFVTYAGFCLFSARFVGRHNLDDILETQSILVHAIAQQYFGCFIQPLTYSDLWLVNSIAKFLVMLFIKTKYGSHEYFCRIYKIMENVCAYEKRWGSICLNSAVPSQTTEPDAEMVLQKGMLVLHAIHWKLGTADFFKVLQYTLTSGLECRFMLPQYCATTPLKLSPSVFNAKVMSSVFKDVSDLFEPWISGAGHFDFDLSYVYNAELNAVRLTVKQNSGRGRFIYKGPLSISVQEVDKMYHHLVEIDNKIEHCDIECHSRNLSLENTKVVLYDNNEVTIDCTRCEPEYPILWINVDIHCSLIRTFRLHQPTINFEIMLLHEPQPVAQLLAIRFLQHGPFTVQTGDVLRQAVLNKEFFFTVRAEAVKALQVIRSKFTSIAALKNEFTELSQQVFTPAEDVAYYRTHANETLDSLRVQYEVNRALM